VVHKDVVLFAYVVVNPAIVSLRTNSQVYCSTTFFFDNVRFALTAVEFGPDLGNRFM